ncbi:Cobalamin synthesis protein P47K [Paraburkholderia piptadeniae]|uniref:Cobalamin synthesis protein P47K n=1 Tax=Paraburkholderia piptadeniae TaxID=1701573 RepID=A0A1N7RVL1_9BURK|nr:GTP-binding protein [Paraburkholderia piptadeniae]SIT39161.1 Cobalamin synthesis protein P47K [Paraburkholderia piptadeniae]
MIAAAQPPIPLAVIGGYLGAGKTTMINAMLANPRGRHVTVLVNDFGSINIDAALIRERSDDVIGLENGCVCCTIGGKLVETLLEISARETRPDLLVIEASGVSDPVRIAQVGMLDRAFRLQGIVVAVDADRIEETLADPYIGDIARRQIEGATAIALTKTDLLNDEKARTVRSHVLEFAHTRIVFEADQGKVPDGLFFSDDALPRERIGSRQYAASTHLPANLRSFTFRSRACFERQQLKAACATFSSRLLRAKGFVRLENGECAEIHVVGDRVHIVRCRERQISESVIVLIGLFEQVDMAFAIDALASAARNPESLS